MDWRPVKPEVEDTLVDESDIVNAEKEHTRQQWFDKVKVVDLYADVILKASLSLFIAFLIGYWFYFMKSTVNYYIYHFHLVDKNVPESVIIATMTLGTTVTSLMVIVLKGLFKSKGN